MQCSILVQQIQNFLDFLFIVGCIVLVQLAIVAVAFFVLDLFFHPPEARPFLFQILDPVLRFIITILISAGIGAYLAHMLFVRFLSKQILYYPIAIFAGLGAVTGVRLWRKFRVSGDSEV